MKADLKLPESQTELLKAVYIAIDLQHEVEFNRIFPRRGNQQNRYYRALMKQYANETGYSKDEAHELFKELHGLKRRVKLINQKRKTKSIIRSTSTYTTKEMKDYIDACIKTMVLAGMEVLSPEEYLANYCKIENQLEKEENRV